jgi:hypothetical protein
LATNYWHDKIEAVLAQIYDAGACDLRPKANMGKPPRVVFVIQLNEARAEWRRNGI